MSIIEKILKVDVETRAITFPSGFTNIGVAGDKDSLRLYFRLPRYYGGFDLSTNTVRINYFNAVGDGGVYVPGDVAIGDDVILFSWLVDELMTKYAGDVRFNITMENDNEDTVYNTTNAYTRVLKGTNPTSSIKKVYPDIVTEWKEELFNKFDGTIDPTLKISGTAADAAITGTKFKKLEYSIASPFNFKGSTTYAKLPKTGLVNDTYYCTDKKCRYTYNGSSWYQSSMNESDYADELSSVMDSTSKIAKNVVSPEDTDFFIVGKNLFNPNDQDFVSGGYYNTNNEYVSGSQYYQSGYIRVKGGNNYTSSYKQAFVLWFDAIKKYIGHTPSGDFNNYGYVTAPEEASYARFITTNTFLSTMQVEEGTVSTDYVQYTSYIKPEHVKHKDALIKPEDTTFFALGKNLFNSEDSYCIHGGYYNKLNVMTTDPNYNQTGYIRVTGGSNYTSSYTGAFVLWYDDLKILIGATESHDFIITGYVTAPDNARYARFIATVDAWDTLQIEEGTYQTSYEPYGTLKLDSTYIPGNNNVKIDDKVFVSYGDSIVARGLWQSYVVGQYAFKHYNLGIGSTTMTYHESIETETPCMVNTDRIQAIKDANPDIVCIMAGTNDAHYRLSIGTDEEFGKTLDDKNKATFKGAYSYLIETLLTWKPLLKIILMTPMHSVYEHTYGYDYSPYADAVRSIGEYYAIYVADTAKKSGISKFDYITYTEDGLHPNVYGAKNIANIVISSIDAMCRVV